MSGSLSPTLFQISQMTNQSRVMVRSNHYAPR
jgi:hypothetical protein